MQAAAQSLTLGMPLKGTLAFTQRRPLPSPPPHLEGELLGVLCERGKAGGTIRAALLLQALLPQLVHQQLRGSKGNGRVGAGWVGGLGQLGQLDAPGKASANSAGSKQQQLPWVAEYQGTQAAASSGPPHQPITTPHLEQLVQLAQQGQRVVRHGVDVGPPRDVAGPRLRLCARGVHVQGAGGAQRGGGLGRGDAVVGAHAARQLQRGAVAVLWGERGDRK